MVAFSETPEGEAFVATGPSRETSPEVMRAIAFFARTLQEAVDLWNGDFDGICTPVDLWEAITNNGWIASDNFVWGGTRQWWADLQSKEA